MPKAKKNGVKNVAALWSRLSEGDFAALDERVLTEDEQQELAEKIKKTASFGDVFHLIDALPSHGKSYDWNIGGLLQHFDVDFVVSSAQHAGNAVTLYESAGLAWAFGQYRNRHHFIVEYLNSVVREARNPDAWWQAAFSLENLGVESAVHLLKRSLVRGTFADIGHYLRNLHDKRSVISILCLCDDSSLSRIYPVVKSAILKGSTIEEIGNACWLAGRLRIMDAAIFRALVRLTDSDDYNVGHNAFYAIQCSPSHEARLFLETCLKSPVSRQRRLAARGLRAMANRASVGVLETALIAEEDPSVVYEMSSSVSRLKNPEQFERLLLKRNSYRIENGTISAGKTDPQTYDAYAEAQDPQAICFDLIARHIGKKVVANPVDINARTGRMVRLMLDRLAYKGNLVGIEPDAVMCDFASKSLRRDLTSGRAVKIACATPAIFAKTRKGESDLVIDAFGFVGADKRHTLRNLKAAYDMLSEGGRFYTIGWDEMYNDALNALWFKYVPDGIPASDFEEWQERRMTASATRTSCGLTWYKRGLFLPLQFRSLEDSSRVMGELFGRDAAQYVIRNRRTEWSMSLGITCDTKKSLKKAIAALEAVR